MRILLGVGGIDTVDLGRLENDFSTDLGAAQGGGRIGRKERVAGAGSKDDRPPLLQVADGFAAYVRLDDLFDVEGRLCLLYTSRCV